MRMKTGSHGNDEHPGESRCTERGERRWKPWFIGSSLVTGILALCWLVLRSGTKPSRLTYPCQRAAMSTALMTLGIPLAGGIVPMRRRVLAGLRTPVGIISAGAVVLIVAGLLSSFPGSGQYGGPILSAPATYRASLYSVTDCQVKPTGDRFIGLDNLIALMGRQGLKFYESATESLSSGPDGIIGTDDLVIIKINYQWSQRGGTNVDLLAGLIRRIVDHPDIFTGEVVVCENAQFASTEGFDRSQNNAKDRTRSPHDVVVDFQTQGYNVSHYDWTLIRGTSADEYSSGDMTDGYIVYDYDPQINGCVSYPKFRTDAGTYVSLKHGIWDPVGETYDRDNMKYINVPVLKSHSAAYGATVNVKNYMGMVTNSLSTNSHNAIATGLLGTAIGEIEPADLSIIDAIYINAVPTAGPSTSYTIATRRNQLVASVDPVAADIWAVKNILIPAFIENGYSPPWPTPSADPGDSTSEFREYLDNSMYQLLAAGFNVTNDTTRIDVSSGNGRAGDFDEDADVDSLDFGQFALCFTGSGGGPVDSSCFDGDFDGDGDIDCDDWVNFQFVWTDSSAIPVLPECTAGITPTGGTRGGNGASIIAALPNPTGHTARIVYRIGGSGKVSLSIFDLRGRLVRTLVDETRGAGEYSDVWDGLNDTGAAVASGVYFCRLDVAGSSDSGRIVISR